MFAPSKDDVRRFFCETWRKHHASELLTPLEAMALDWILEHPEYHADLASSDAPSTEYRVEDGRTNAFLHLSMHLAIAEQLSIEQPSGVRAEYRRLVTRLLVHHAAAHEVMECLGETLWAAQRAGSVLTPEAMNERYLECLRRRASR